MIYGVEARRRRRDAVAHGRRARPGDRRARARRPAAARRRRGARSSRRCSRARPRPRPRSCGGCFTGELRQGALAGLMADAVAAAAGVPAGARAARADALGRPARRPRELALGGGERGAARRSASSSSARCCRCSPRPRPSVERGARRASSEASVEWKLDGIRIQVHRRGDEVRIYTRNLNDDHRRAARGRRRRPRAAGRRRSCSTARRSCDGRRRPGRVPGHGRRGSTPAARRRAIVTFLFDVLHLDGARPARRAAARARARALEAIARRARDARRAARPTPARRSACSTRRSPPGTRASSSRTRASPYAAGRRGKAWRKVKPVRTLDLVVLGAEWGHGRRQGWLSNLHLGARDPATAAS